MATITGATDTEKVVGEKRHERKMLKTKVIIAGRVAGLNFSGEMTPLYILGTSILLPLILKPTARRMGGRVTQEG